MKYHATFKRWLDFSNPLSQYLPNYYACLLALASICTASLPSLTSYVHLPVQSSQAKPNQVIHRGSLQGIKTKTQKNKICRYSYDYRTFTSYATYTPFERLALRPQEGLTYYVPIPCNLAGFSSPSLSPPFFFLSLTTRSKLSDHFSPYEHSLTTTLIYLLRR